MLLRETEQFLDEVTRRVKFSYDRREIRAELENHIIDKRDDLVEQGYEMDEAERQAVSGMGDGKEVGMALNREHNPWLGWLWFISGKMVVLMVFLMVFYLILPIMTALDWEPGIGVSKDEIVYSAEVDERAEIDNRVIQIDKVIYDENRYLYIYYRILKKEWWKLGGYGSTWIGDYRDDLGNFYYNMSGGSSNGGLTGSKGMYRIENFSPEANKLIISYNRFNRVYELVIPVKGVGRSE